MWNSNGNLTWAVRQVFWTTYFFVCLSIQHRRNGVNPSIYNLIFRKRLFLSFPRLSPVLTEYTVLTWVDKRLTIVYTSTVSRIKVPAHIFTQDLLHSSLILSSHLGLRARVKTLSIFLFLQNIKLNFPLYMWHVFCKFAQKTGFLLSYLIKSACCSCCF